MVPPLRLMRPVEPELLATVTLPELVQLPPERVTVPLLPELLPMRALVFETVPFGAMERLPEVEFPTVRVPLMVQLGLVAGLGVTLPEVVTWAEDLRAGSATSRRRRAQRRGDGKGEVFTGLVCEVTCEPNRPLSQS